MSTNTTIYESLIKIGVKPKRAQKISKELVEKAKLNPVLSEKELKAEMSRLSEAIGDLSSSENKQAINYLHAIIQGLIASGIFELLVLLKSFLGTFFASSPTVEIQQLMQAKALIKRHVHKQVSSETSDAIMEHALSLDAEFQNLIKTSLVTVTDESASKLLSIISETLENMVSAVEYKHAVELGIINKT